MKRQKILVECYNDERLFLAFKISKYDIEHSIGGKSEVLEKIKNKTNSLAVIDNDKRIMHSYFKKANLIDTISSDIKVYYESNGKNYFLVFYPCLESVIERIFNSDPENISTANRLKLNISNKGLHNIGSNEIKLKKLKDLFMALIIRSQNIKAI